MVASTIYQPLVLSVMQDIVNHGWGELVFKVESLKDNKVKVVVLAGKSYVYIIKKTIDFSGDDII